MCLLIEQPLAHTDAEEVVALHAEAAEPAHYHVLLPVADPVAQMEGTLGSLAATEVMATAPLALLPEDAERIRDEAMTESRQALDRSVSAIAAAGGSADGELVLDEPVQRLTAAVRERDSREVIILTRPHLVADLFHTDWTHRARRILGVPVLHLLGHRDSSN